MVEPFKALTKSDIAEVLGCSVRNVENLVSSGTLPKPGAVGRLVRWHSDVFYQWLDATLKGQARTEETSSEASSCFTPEDYDANTSARTCAERNTSAFRRMHARDAKKFN